MTLCQVTQGLKTNLHSLQHGTAPVRMKCFTTLRCFLLISEEFSFSIKLTYIVSG